MGIESVHRPKAVYPWRTGVVVHASGGEHSDTPPEGEKIPAGKITKRRTLKQESGGRFSSVWKGSISPSKRVREGSVQQREIDTYTDPEKLETYYMPTDTTARMRCVDGRTTDESAAKIRRGETIEDDRSLGPQIPGGTPGSALASRIISDEDPTGKTLSQDIIDIVAEFDRSGIAIGGHIDDHSGHGHDMTGCGAIDKIPLIFDILDNRQAQKQIKTLTKSLLGASYNDTVVAKIFSNIGKLHKNRNQYLEKNGNEYAYRPVAIHSLKEHNPDSVEKMVGPHNEVALVINTVEGTTLNRGRLNQDSGGKVQVFNYDVWASIMIAERLYPNDPAMQAMYLTCRVMLAIATMMALTDGSVTLMVRTENGEKNGKRPKNGDGTGISKKPKINGDSGPGKIEKPKDAEGTPTETKPENPGGTKTPAAPKEKDTDPHRENGGERKEGNQGGTTFRTPIKFGERRRTGSGFMARMRESAGNIIRSVRETAGSALKVPVRAFRNLVEYAMSYLPFNSGRGFARGESGDGHDTEVWAGGISIGVITYALVSVFTWGAAPVTAAVAGITLGVITAIANYAHNNDVFA